MYAVVKNIKTGTRRKCGDGKDSFVRDMKQYIGVKIEITQSDYDPNWFESNDSGGRWSYHKDWLEFEEDQMDFIFGLLGLMAILAAIMVGLIFIVIAVQFPTVILVYFLIITLLALLNKK